MKKTVSLCAAVMASVVLMTGTVVAAPMGATNLAFNNVQPLEESGQRGRVGWERGVIEAIGTGVAPDNATSPAQGAVLARRAAIVDAYRNLAEAIYGVQVDSETTMRNLAVDDVVKVRVSGLVKGAKIVSEKAMANGTYLIVMSANLYGPDSVASIAFNAIRPEQIQKFPGPSPSYIPSATPRNELYTGVIIDARGLDLQSAFSPRVYDETGSIAYGNKYINTDFAISQGMVEYTINPEMAQAAERGQSRAGSRPLIIKALRIADNGCNVVISTADANAMLSYNQSGAFLQNCAVVFEK